MPENEIVTELLLNHSGHNDGVSRLHRMRSQAVAASSSSRAQTTMTAILWDAETAKPLRTFGDIQMGLIPWR